LITTYQLFKLVQRVLDAPRDADHADLRRLLLECDGELRRVDAA